MSAAKATGHEMLYLALLHSAATDIGNFLTKSNRRDARDQESLNLTVMA